jgi:hypothetical protein
MSFVLESSVNIAESNNLFFDLAYCVPFLYGAVDADLAGKLSRTTLLNSFDPKFFQIPYIYSYADNIANGNFKATILKDDDKVTITSYDVPYKGEFSEQSVTTVTTLVKATNILFHTIPREFTYNSDTSASIAYSKDSNGNFTGIFLVPRSFVNDKFIGNIKYDFKIEPESTIVTEQAQPSASKSHKRKSKVNVKSRIKSEDTTSYGATY